MITLSNAGWEWQRLWVFIDVKMFRESCIEEVTSTNIKMHFNERYMHCFPMIRAKFLKIWSMIVVICKMLQYSSNQSNNLKPNAKDPSHYGKKTLRKKYIYLCWSTRTPLVGLIQIVYCYCSAIILSIHYISFLNKKTKLWIFCSSTTCEENKVINSSRFFFK